MKDYKWGDCIQCGWCCIDSPCGIPSNAWECELLTPINDYQYSCPHWPFEHLDHFTRSCMSARAGCSNPNFNNKRYVETWKWLKSKEADHEQSLQSVG